MTRHHMTQNGPVPFTEEEELAHDAGEKEWAASANDRLADEHRVNRNDLLAASDWTQANDSPLTDEAKASWVTYRTALRDLPSHSNWPSLEDSDWPAEPS